MEKLQDKRMEDKTSNEEKIKRYVTLMCERRGYTHLEETRLDDDSWAIVGENKPRKDGTPAPVDNTDHSKIMIIPAMDKALAEQEGNPDGAYKLCIRAMKRAIGIFLKHEVGLGIILYNAGSKKSGITSSAKNVFSAANKAGEVKIQIFDTVRFGYDILSHRYQPKSFKIVKGKEEKEFKKKFPDPSLHRKMKVDDVIAEYYRYKVGMIIKVTRKCGTVSYLCVVPGGGKK